MEELEKIEKEIYGNKNQDDSESGDEEAENSEEKEDEPVICI